MVDDSHEPFIPIQSLLAGFCGDQDSRVRASSFNAMVRHKNFEGGIFQSSTRDSMIMNEWEAEWNVEEEKAVKY